jgi:phytoene/squalene synthetase
MREAGSPRAFAPAVRELAHEARQHLHEARRSRRTVPSRALPALLPGTLVNGQLARLRALGARSGPRRQPPLAPLWLLGYRALGIF